MDMKCVVLLAFFVLTVGLSYANEALVARNLGCVEKDERCRHNPKCCDADQRCVCGMDIVAYTCRCRDWIKKNSV